jgi:glycosyltransferase involved in cell wall biosynthesis
VLNCLVDRLAARQLEGTKLFVGWSQVSLHSLRAARERGAFSALEHPMLHVELWQETMREEYARFAPDAAEFYSLFPDSLVSRMLAEYQEADRIVVPSSAARASFLERGVPEERLVTVPFGVDTTYFAPRRRRQQRFKVGFVGRLELLKGPQYLLQAWSFLRLENSTLSLVGPVLPEMQAHLGRIAASRSVELLGQLDRGDVRRFMDDCDVLVFPTICDAFGLVMLEAMACGRPVIATTRSGAHDVISDGVDGFVVPPKDPKAIAERIDWLHSHRDDCSEMGRRARLKVESRFTLRHYGARLEQAYRTMMLSTGDRSSPDTPTARRT